MPTITKPRPKPTTKRPRPRPAPTKPAARESAAAIAKRLGPMRAIVRWEANPRKAVKTQIAILECGHARALSRGPRKSYRCNQCRIEQRDGSPVLSRYQKALAASGKPPVILTPQSRRAARKAATVAAARADAIVRDPYPGREPEVERVAAYD